MYAFKMFYYSLDSDKRYAIACVAGGFKGLEFVALATKTARKNTRGQRKIRPGGEARATRENAGEKNRLPQAAKPRVNELSPPTMQRAII